MILQTVSVGVRGGGRRWLGRTKAGGRHIVGVELY